MQIPLSIKLFFLFAFYCILDLSIKNYILKTAVSRANKASKIQKN